MKKVYKIAIGIALVSGLVALVMILLGNIAQAGPFVLVFFTALGIGFRGFDVLKGFSFGMIIFALVATGLYYPQHFIEWNGFQLSVLIIPMIQLIMFGMG
ncbi:MAG TPA: hypothetical protein VKZ51_09600, partial [Cyclobacteriaceae bacterium]|nr:hypothetical protein [Cyclobacteriaceae bacterium]